MSAVSVLIADMVRAGVDPDIIGRTAEAIADAAREAPRPRTARQERNRRYYEKSKASETRLIKTDQDVSDAFQKETSPVPPKEKLSPLSPPKGGHFPPEFLQFWEAYPHKVGKRDAEKAFLRARKRVEFAPLMAGLRRYVGKTDDRPWCNPATWLNQDRWTDAPAGGNGQAILPIVEDDQRWKTRLRWARANSAWDQSAWGAPPGSERCRVPKHLLTADDLQIRWKEFQGEAA